VTILWGYNKTQPIAKIENTTTTQLKNALGVSDLNAVNESNLNAINALRQGLPNAMVTTYTHIPLVGVSSITDPKGQTVYYNYDGLGRLKNVKDAQGNIISENEYHYKN
jgi:YD repeat-containing protein